MPDLDPMRVRLKLWAMSAVAVAVLLGCSRGNLERRPYLITENMDRAEKHRAAGDLVEAAEIYSIVVLADPLNQVAQNRLQEIGGKGQMLIKPTVLGVNRKRAALKPSLAWALALYPFNRVLDITDILSFHLGLEGGLLLDLHMTRALQAGFGGGGGLQIGWWQKRNLGLGVGHIGELDFGPVAFSNEGFARMGTGGLLADNYALVGLNRPLERSFQRHYDYYGAGFRVILLLLGVSVEFHPMEVADAVGGFFLLDFLHDDLGQTRSLKLDRNDRAVMDELVNTLSASERRHNLKTLSQLSAQETKPVVPVAPAQAAPADDRATTGTLKGKGSK